MQYGLSQEAVVEALQGVAVRWSGQGHKIKIAHHAAREVLADRLPLRSTTAAAVGLVVVVVVGAARTGYGAKG